MTKPHQSQILVVLLCMLSVFRPSFEVVKEGRIFTNSNLQTLIGDGFLGASLVPWFE
jgi:hypothetical protein